MADFEPVDLVPVLSARHQASTDELQSRIGSREILLEGSGNSKRSADVLLFRWTTRSLDQNFFHFGEYGGWNFENAVNDFRHTFAAAWRKFNPALLGVRDKFGIGKSC